jgi:hypothetical protein
MTQWLDPTRIGRNYETISYVWSWLFYAFAFLAAGLSRTMRFSRSIEKLFGDEYNNVRETKATFHFF